MFSTFKPTLRCGNDRDVENQRFPPSLWKTLRVYHIPTTAPNSSFSCVNVYADSLRKRMRLLTNVLEGSAGKIEMTISNTALNTILFYEKGSIRLRVTNDNKLNFWINGNAIVSSGELLNGSNNIIITWKNNIMTLKLNNQEEVSGSYLGTVPNLSTISSHTFVTDLKIYNTIN